MMTGCNSDGQFDVDEIGPALTDVGERANQTAVSFDQSLDENPAVDAAFPEARRVNSFIRLAGELLLLVGLGLTWKRKTDAEKVVVEADANPNTPPLAEQVTTQKAKQSARKISA